MPATVLASRWHVVGPQVGDVWAGKAGTAGGGVCNFQPASEAAAGHARHRAEWRHSSASPCDVWSDSLEKGPMRIERVSALGDWRGDGVSHPG
jgi:hypothetical protein